MDWSRNFRLLSIFVVILAISYQYALHFVWKEAVGPSSRFNITITNSQLVLERTEHGVMSIEGLDWNDVWKGVGYAHAKDRGTQMLLLRMIAQGRIAECISSDEKSLNIDRFVRIQGFSRIAPRIVQKLSESSKAVLGNYSDGVNGYLQENGIPFELRLAGFVCSDSWKAEDTFSIMRLMMYFGMGDIQQHSEKLIIETMLGGGETFEFTKLLFKPYLDGIDPSYLDIVKKLQLYENGIPSEISSSFAKASNNWAVSGNRSRSGHAMYASDPHMNVMQLPSIWYETILGTKNGDNYAMGITFPGLPGILMGRTKYIAWGFTFGFMDHIDYFIEHCKGQSCLRGNESIPVKKTLEVIKQKDGTTATVLPVYESIHGILELPFQDTDQAIDDGYYLAQAYTLYDEDSMLSTFDTLDGLLQCRHVKEFQKIARLLQFSTNMIAADIDGNIAYQQTGRPPIRARVNSELYPLFGWDPSNDWKGFLNPDLLGSSLNPPSGILVSANDGRDRPEGPRTISLHMGSHRTRRIEKLLNEREKLDVDDFKRIQSDRYSSQAEAYMEHLRPLLSAIVNNRSGTNDRDLSAQVISTAEKFLHWDLVYSRKSQIAPLFDAFRAALIEEVCAPYFGGPANWKNVVQRLVGPFYVRLDELLLTNHSDSRTAKMLWKNESREDYFTRVLLKVLKSEPIRTLERMRSYYMENVLFRGKFSWLTRPLGIDYGPIAIEGSSSSICQGSLWLGKDGSADSFAPSWRLVTDLGTDIAETILAGGPSGNFLSGLYTTDIPKWLNFQYKILSPFSSDQKSLT